MLLAAGCIAGHDAVAQAHDSLAPPGASHNWLPDEEWVHRHWVPFDEQTLKTRLGLRGLELQAYLYDDHRTLAMLANTRAIDVDRLADELVAPWQGITDAHRSLLRARTLQILTQGHLAQHMFFHVFHGRHLNPFADQLFGMPGPRYRALRTDGLTLVQIAERGGVSQRRLRSALERLIEGDARDGIARQEAWPAESGQIVRRTLAWLPCWISRPAASLDPTNPYGKNRQLHGRHSARWPATARERRSDELRVDRWLRRMPTSCWSRPPIWNWATYRSRAA